MKVITILTIRYIVNETLYNTSKCKAITIQKQLETISPGLYNTSKCKVITIDFAVYDVLG